MSSVTGVALTGANGEFGLAALVAFACNAFASENKPLTRWPAFAGLGSETLSVASPAELLTVAATVVS